MLVSYVVISFILKLNNATVLSGEVKLLFKKNTQFFGPHQIEWDLVSASLQAPTRRTPLQDPDSPTTTSWNREGASCSSWGRAPGFISAKTVPRGQEPISTKPTDWAQNAEARERVCGLLAPHLWVRRAGDNLLNWGLLKFHYWHCARRQRHPTDVGGCVLSLHALFLGNTGNPEMTTTHPTKAWLSGRPGVHWSGGQGQLTDMGRKDLREK